MRDDLGPDDVYMLNNFPGMKPITPKTKVTPDMIPKYTKD